MLTSSFVSSLSESIGDQSSFCCWKYIRTSESIDSKLGTSMDWVASSHFFISITSSGYNGCLKDDSGKSQCFNDLHAWFKAIYRLLLFDGCMYTHWRMACLSDSSAGLLPFIDSAAALPGGLLSPLDATGSKWKAIWDRLTLLLCRWSMLMIIDNGPVFVTISSEIRNRS